MTSTQAMAEFADCYATDLGPALGLLKLAKSNHPGMAGWGLRTRNRLSQAASTAPASEKEEPHAGTEPQGWRARGDRGPDRRHGAGSQGPAGPVGLRGASGRADLAGRAVVPGPQQDGRESRPGGCP